MKTVDFANSIDPDEVAQPPHLDLHCLPCTMKHFFVILQIKFCYLLF